MLHGAGALIIISDASQKPRQLPAECRDEDEASDLKLRTPSLMERRRQGAGSEHGQSSGHKPRDVYLSLRHAFRLFTFLLLHTRYFHDNGSLNGNYVLFSCHLKG